MVYIPYMSIVELKIMYVYLKAVEGTPSSSFSNLTFLIATVSLLTKSLDL